MMKEPIEKAFNEQINAETFSAYLYWSMSAWFETINLSGAAAWMRAQAQEEMLHAMKFFHHINERGGAVKLTAIEAPQTEWDSPLAAFEAAYKHEQYISQRIDDLVTLAREQKDYACESMLQWFTDEQVEEEATVDQVVQQLKLSKEAPGALFMIDRELGQRSFTPPPAEGEGA